MITSIGKFSKSFFIKVLVGIIILPFVFWGMGDVFRGGSQNVIASIDSEKISTQEFVDYIRRLNLNEKQIKDLPKTDLSFPILTIFFSLCGDLVYPYSKQLPTCINFFIFLVSKMSTRYLRPR